MGCRRTDCMERPLSRLFEKLGGLVGSYPIGFFIVPLVVSFILGGGFYFIEKRTDNDIELQFTPRDGPSKKARAVVQEYFPRQKSEFSSQRLVSEGHYATIIAVAKGKSNIMTKEAFEDIIKLDHKVKSVSVVENKWTFVTLCVKVNGGCVPNDLLEIIEYDASKIGHMDIFYPVHNSSAPSKHTFLGSTIGGVRRKENGVIDFAKAVKFVYFLENKGGVEKWLQQFQKTFLNDHGYKNVMVSYYTSQSKQEEIDKLTADGIPLFSITYALAITFSVVSCLRLDNVRNKVWVALIGVLSAGLAVLSSFGLLLYAGVPFVMTVANSPFLILGIGVDDMFIMVSNWQNTNVKDSVPKRMAHTYKEAAMSITITTLTDVLGFYIGLMSDFPSIQYFCLYTSTAIIFCYVYNITFFGAFMALNGRREERNGHWLTYMKVPTEAPAKSSSWNTLCCVGGDYDKETGAEKIQPVNNFFKNYYGPLLTKPWAKAAVILIYAGYLAGSIYGCFHVEQGIDLKDLAADDSYVISYYERDRKYFSGFGPNVMLVVREPFPYWDTTKRSELRKCTDDFRELDFVSKRLYTSWLDAYEHFGKKMNLNLNNKKSFMANLPKFFVAVPEFKQDVNITRGTIPASRFFIQTVHISNSSMEIKMMNGLEEKMKTCGAAPLITFHPAFIYYDQYAVIVPSTVLNIGVTTAVMLVISLLLIPNPLCSIWVTVSIGSVIVGVTGFMALWGVKLDTVSMIILVVCIGFTVDFSAHISYCFVSSKKPSANGRMVDALFMLGYPIMQGALSTILGVVVLAASKNHIFRTFFKIMTLVMVFGLLHGITFLPVFLTLFSCCSSEKDEEKQEVKDSVAAHNVMHDSNRPDDLQYAYDNKDFEQCHRNIMIWKENLKVHKQQLNVYVIGSGQHKHPCLEYDPDCP
ncbi:patched domain-containing protein 3-like [Gadus macrocephalus]|uniref:patched domain-containing protein 3-like n=1 Tax=Gadus macrocephalus TaxID=80720 RepID=UPI0028CB4703|nr:patched domain-containing protein 3-like [Gadus macrocephalus]